MYSLAKLLGQMPMVNQARMTASGVAVWAAWSAQGNKALFQTIKDHGGVVAATDGAQALWFFFDKEAYRALARLHVWLRLHPQEIFFEVMPASILVNHDLSFAVGLPPDLRDQSVVSLGDPEIWLHPKLHEAVAAIPGLSFRPGKMRPGMSGLDWKLFGSDPSYSFESELGWYFIVKPLGKKLDYSAPWRFFLARAEVLLQRLGFKFLCNDSFLILPLDNLRLLRSFCREIIQLLREIKAESEGSYWPMVMATVPKRGHNFNEDLPRKIALEWQRLTPGLPHLSYRDSFILGDEYRVIEVGGGLGHGSMDDWCAVDVKNENNERQVDEVTLVRLPRKLLSGSGPECFYCGLKSHTPEQCPVKGLQEFPEDTWEDLARLALADFKKASLELEQFVEQTADEGLAEAMKLPDRRGVLARAMVEIAGPFQPRYLRLVWRSRGKDPTTAFEGLAPQEGEYFWTAMDRFQAGEAAEAESQIRQATQRYPRGYQSKSLAGMLAMEQGDLVQGLYCFQEATRLTAGVMQKIAFTMLQGRVYEISQDFEKALAAYREAESNTRAWPESRYRQAACMIKMGFVDHALGMVVDLVDKDPQYFNKFMVDPELDRGRSAIQAALAEVWREGLARRQEGRTQLAALENKVTLWFAPESPFGVQARAALADLACMSAVDNYVYFRRFLVGCSSLEAETERQVDFEVTRLSKNVKAIHERLKDIVREASWFPFPRLLREFNRDFNTCAARITWVLTKHLKNPDNYKQAKEYVQELNERMASLDSRLISLRILRDSAFFTLMLGRSYIWLQIVALGLSLAMFPVLLFGAQSLPGPLADYVLSQKWQIQKGLVIVLSCLAMVSAVLRTAMGFDKRKQQFFSEEFVKNQERRETREKNRKEEYKAKLAARRAARSGGAAAKSAASAGDTGAAAAVQ